jgi:hypothetical protein
MLVLWALRFARRSVKEGGACLGVFANRIYYSRKSSVEISNQSTAWITDSQSTNEITAAAAAVGASVVKLEPRKRKTMEDSCVGKQRG